MTEIASVNPKKGKWATPPESYPAFGCRPAFGETPKCRQLFLPHFYYFGLKIMQTCIKSWKKLEKGKVYERLECLAPKRWSKFTTQMTGSILQSRLWETN